MPDKDFPSGPWTGFYQYNNGKRGSQDLRLDFTNGRMTGTGADELGQFFIEGSYDSTSKEAKWVKTYPHAHSIEYRGFRDGPVKGIWGTWMISSDWHGGFHIWPLSETVTEDEEDETALPLKLTKLEQQKLSNAIGNTLRARRRAQF